jgi:enoyl-CoA hydratase/carnithine racemase
MNIKGVNIMFNFITFETAPDLPEEIARIFLNRPNKKNAINQEMLEEFNLVLEHIEQNNVIKIVLIEGMGDSFSAGADLGEVSRLGDSKSFAKFLVEMQNVFSQIRKSNKLFIAVLKGHVLGGGFELALHCDFRIASKDSKLGMPEIKIGLLPGAGGIYDLVHLVGTEKAMEFICMGDIITAEEAFRYGLIYQIAERCDLQKVSLEIAMNLASRSSAALQTAKKLVRKSNHVEDEISEKQYEAESIGLLFDSVEVKRNLLNFARKQQ